LSREKKRDELEKKKRNLITNFKPDELKFSILSVDSGAF